MKDISFYDVVVGSEPIHKNQQLELDLGVSEAITIKAQSYIDIRLFSFNEIENVCHLFDSCRHRIELKWLIRNMHNWNEYPRTEMGSLLRYADAKARIGIYVLMEKFAQGKSLDLLLNPDFLHEQF